MYNITGKKDLEAAILLIESEVEDQKILLKDQIKSVYESFNPVNVINRMYNKAVNSKELRSTLLIVAIGIATGYLTKKMFFGAKEKKGKGLLANLLQFGVANLNISPSGIMNTLLAPFLKYFNSKGDKDPFVKKKTSNINED